MFSVFVSLFAMWHVTILTMNNVAGKKCGWVFAPTQTRFNIECDMHEPKDVMGPTKPSHSIE